MSEKNTKEYHLVQHWIKDAYSPKRMLNDIISHGNIIPEFSSRFLKIDVRPISTGKKSKQWGFFGKESDEYKYQYWLIIDVNGFDEHQLELLNAYMLGWIAGIHAGRTRGIF